MLDTAELSDCEHVCVHACACACLCAYVCVHMCVHVFMDVHVCVCTCVCQRPRGLALAPTEPTFQAAAKQQGPRAWFAGSAGAARNQDLLTGRVSLPRPSRRSGNRN